MPLHAALKSHMTAAAATAAVLAASPALPARAGPARGHHREEGQRGRARAGPGEARGAGQVQGRGGQDRGAWPLQVTASGIRNAFGRTPSRGPEDASVSPTLGAVD